MPAGHRQLYCYTRVLLGLSGLVLIKYINIKTKSFAHGSKHNISNLYSGLSIDRNSSINVILAPYLASFNCHLT